MTDVAKLAGVSHQTVSRVINGSPQVRPATSDDLEAEVIRLEALGARKVQRFPRWWVMEAPTGQRFCVVRPQNKGFDQDANVWK